MSDKTPVPAAETPANPLASPAFGRFLRIWLIAVVGLLAYQTLFPAAPRATADAAVTLTVANGTALSIPHLPQLTVTNPTASGVTFDTCKDLSFKVNGATVKDLPVPCHAVSVAASGGTYSFAQKDKGEFVALATYFQVPATWEFVLAMDGKTLSQSVTLSRPGAFKGFFLAAVYEPIYNLFVFLIREMPGRNLGWAIVLLTVIVRLVLLYPQHHMLATNRKMQALQPKIKALQEKHKGDQQALGAEFMRLYKEEGVNPLGSFLPLLVQTPIMLMLYWVILEVDHVVNTYYLYGFMGSFDPASVDTRFFGLDLVMSHTPGNLVLAVLSAAAQFAQLRLSQAINKKPAQDNPAPKDPNVPDMEQMMKVMVYAVPVMVAVSTYVFPAGVGVYWFVGTLFVTAQQFVADRLHKAKEAAKAAKA